MLRFVVFLDHFRSPMGWFDPYLGIVCCGCLPNSELAFRHSTWNWLNNVPRTGVLCDYIQYFGWDGFCNSIKIPLDALQQQNNATPLSNEKLPLATKDSAHTPWLQSSIGLE